MEEEIKKSSSDHKDLELELLRAQHREEKILNELYLRDITLLRSNQKAEIEELSKRLASLMEGSDLLEEEKYLM